MLRVLLGSVLAILSLSFGARLGRLSAQTATNPPRTFEQLRAAAFTAADLPGYNLDYEGPGALDGKPVAFADYDAIWIDARPASPHEIVNLGLTSLRSINPAETPAALANGYAGTHANVTPLGSQGIGDDDQALFASVPGSDGSDHDV